MPISDMQRIQDHITEELQAKVTELERKLYASEKEVAKWKGHAEEWMRIAKKPIPGMKELMAGFRKATQTHGVYVEYDTPKGEETPCHSEKLRPQDLPPGSMYEHGPGTWRVEFDGLHRAIRKSPTGAWVVFPDDDPIRPPDWMGPINVLVLGTHKGEETENGEGDH